MSDVLAAAVAHAVARLPPTHITRLIARLEDCDGTTSAGRSALSHAIENDGFASVVRRLCDAWCSMPGLPGTAIALALASASLVEAARPRVAEVVWTGPPTEFTGGRTTTAVLFDLIRQAHRSITLMSFSAYPVCGLVEELHRACTRGVALRFILESSAASGGRLTMDAAAPFAALRSSAAFYSWPGEKRPPGAVLHAKAAIADRRIALVTSANLTERAIESNLELGLRCTDETIAERIDSALDELIGKGTLVAVQV